MPNKIEIDDDGTKIKRTKDEKNKDSLFAKATLHGTPPPDQEAMQQRLPAATVPPVVIHGLDKKAGQKELIEKLTGEQNAVDTYIKKKGPGGPG